MSSSTGKARARDLTHLVNEGRMKVPDAAEREVDDQNDRLSTWLANHQGCIQRATNENSTELARISRQHGPLFGYKSGSADPVVVTMGGYYKAGGWTVLTDDAGVQAACFVEG